MTYGETDLCFNQATNLDIGVIGFTIKETEPFKSNQFYHRSINTLVMKIFNLQELKTAKKQGQPEK